MLKSRVLLLQLMQNCFPMLPNPLEPRGPEDSKGPDEGATAAASPSTSSTSEPVSEPVRAVSELYAHLCLGKNLPPLIQVVEWSHVCERNYKEHQFVLFLITVHLLI